jgi:hypothetical protein
MKPKPIPANGDEPQHVLNKRLTVARTAETQAREHAQITREKKLRMELAERRGELIPKKLAQDQAAFLFVAMRQKMLGAGLGYHRKLLACKTPHAMIQGINEMMCDMLRELHDMPAKITDPHWIETLDEDKGNT